MKRIGCQLSKKTRLLRCELAKSFKSYRNIMFNKSTPCQNCIDTIYAYDAIMSQVHDFVFLTVNYRTEISFNDE